jgi:hypothetical protein
VIGSSLMVYSGSASRLAREGRTALAILTNGATGPTAWPRTNGAAECGNTLKTAVSLLAGRLDH